MHSPLHASANSPALPLSQSASVPDSGHCCARPLGQLCGWLNVGFRLHGGSKRTLRPAAALTSDGRYSAVKGLRACSP